MANSFFRVRKGLTVANSSASANLDPGLLTIGSATVNSTVANIDTVNATTVNAATLAVGTLFTATDSLVNAAAINSRGQVNTVTLFATTSANVGANVQLTTTTIKVGNSTANLQANSILVRVVNSTASANLSPGNLAVPNVTITGVLSANGGVGTPGQILKTDGSAKVYWADQSAANPSGATKQIQINDNGSFGANAWFTFDITTTTVVIGNSSVNVVANNTLIKIANSTNIANLSPLALSIGTSTVNSTVLAAGANVIVGVSSLAIGNSSANLYANSIQVKIANSTATANLSAAQLSIGSSLVNSTAMYVGANTHLDVYGFSIGNSVANVSSNSSLISVANSTSSANLHPTQLLIGDSKINTVGIAVGANIIISSSELRIGNSSINTVINSTSLSGGTVNNALYLGGQPASYYLDTSDLSPYQTTAGLASNVATMTSNNATYLGGTHYGDYQTEAGLSSNVATMTANSANYIGLLSAASVVSHTQLSDNLANYQTTTELAANVATMTSNNATYLGGTHYGDYQTEAGLSSNVATMTANNANYIGGTAAANIPNTSVATFSSSVNVGANIQLSTSALRIGNLSSNIYANSTSIQISSASGNTYLNSTALSIGAVIVNSSVFTGTANNATNLGGVAASSYLTKDVTDQAITGGARVTELDLGAGSGTVTPDPGDRPMQIITNNTAFTLSPGSNYGCYYLTITNASGAGTITTSSWTKVTGSFTTTIGHKFRCGCSIGAGGSLLQIQAMQ